jgi:cyanophycinase
MKYKSCLLKALLLLTSLTGFCQQDKNLLIKGKLFIIGGGERSPGLMKSLVATAKLKKEDYIVILPMASESGDTAYYYLKQDFEQVCPNAVANLNFTKQLVNDKRWLDSLQKSKLIFIAGGDQSRFMDIVLHTPVQDAIVSAFTNGSTIGGTSAGAAVMSKQMITGNEYSGDSLVPGSFRKIRYHFVEIKEGLGLLNTSILLPEAGTTACCLCWRSFPPVPVSVLMKAPQS